MNTIRPSASRPSHPSTTNSTKTMDLVAAAAAALEASSASSSPQKRPINHASNYGSNYNHHQHSHNHNDRRKNMPMMGHLDSWRIDKGLETQSMSNADSAALRASLTQSRQTWTHSAFSRFKPQTANNGGHKAQFAPVSEVSLAGVCTVSIGPHIFLDTKFFTVLNTDNESHAIKSESTRDRSRSPSRQRNAARHQVALEFKENSGTQWLFPEEASLEFFPANDRDSAQITASFSLPLRDQSRQGRPQQSRAGDQDIAVDMTISHATTALWEGLELAVKGPRTVHRSGAHRSHAGGHRSRTSSTYDEDPSEILGSGKKTSQNSESPSTKRKQDALTDHQKATKLKKPKHEQDMKPSVKKAGTSTSPRKNGTSASSASSSMQQKRCGYCNCSSTPMWRRGPKGPSTLCNACGVKWKHGKILQDQSDTQGGPKVGGSSSSASHTTSASRPPPSKVSKETSVNTGQPADELSSHTRNNKKASPGAGHGGRRDSKISEPEKMIPVKKRHLAPPMSPVGPRMVPIHQLDNRDQTPAPKKNGLTHLLDVASEELKSTLLASARNKASAIQSAPSVVHAPTPASPPLPAPAPTLVSIPTPASATVPATAPSTATRPDENGLALYPVRTTFTNNTATFPLHFPTISVGFGPNNASYNYPNCAVVLYENHFQIQLVQAGERTAIDVWKEGIEGTEFQVVDVGDGESMIVMKALSRQYLTRFDKELLNPDRNETLIVFRFRERLGGGGPPVKPLLEHWLATDIPVPPPPTTAMDETGA